LPSTGNFVGAVPSAFTQQPTRKAIQLIEDSELESFSISDFDACCAAHHDLDGPPENWLISLWFRSRNASKVSGFIRPTSATPNWKAKYSRASAMRCPD